MTQDLLHYLAARGGASLHAKGRLGTMGLLADLPTNLLGPVLEIGCGTGETAVQLCRSSSTVIAADISSLMLEGARGRARWCGVAKRLLTVQISPCGELPFATGTFGVVVVESVLAIQSPETLHRMVSEIRRVVHPRGRVLVNETVWMPATPPDLAASINRRAVESIGTIQATENPFDAEQWMRMFEDSGLRSERIQRLDDLVRNSHQLATAADDARRLATLVTKIGEKCRLVAVRFVRARISGLVFRSRAYTAWRLFRSLLTSGGLTSRRHMKIALGKLTPPNRCLEGTLFVLAPFPSGVTRSVETPNE